jgi:hypothetical protein
MKVKLYLDSEEYYPVYIPARHPSHLLTEYVVEVDEEFRARFDRVLAEFNELQDEIAEMVEHVEYLPNRKKSKEDV